MASKTTVVSKTLAPLALENIGSAAQPAFLYGDKQVWFFVPDENMQEGYQFASRFTGITQLASDQILAVVSGKASDTLG